MDTKTYPFPNEEIGAAPFNWGPLHEMWIQLTINQFYIHEAEACIDAAPFGICPAIASRYQQLIGVRMGQAGR